MDTLIAREIMRSRDEIDLAIEVDRHIIANEYGDLLLLFCCFELSNKCLCVE